MVRWRKRSRSSGSESARSSARRRPVGDEASDPSPRLTARSREHSVRQRDPLAEVSPASLKRGARRHHRLCRNERRWLPGAWVLVFDNVGCISRPDASRIASRSRRSERVAAGEPARGEPRHLRLWVSRSEASDGRAKLSTLRGQPGGQNRAAKEHFASIRARLKALRVEGDLSLIRTSCRDPRSNGSTAQRRSLRRVSGATSGPWLWSHWAVPGWRQEASETEGRRQRLLQPKGAGGQRSRRAHLSASRQRRPRDCAASKRVARLLSASWQSQHLCHLRPIQPARTARVSRRSPQQAMMPSSCRRTRSRRSVKPRAGMLGAKPPTIDQ
jgi:hypothetical protein